MVVHPFPAVRVETRAVLYKFTVDPRNVFDQNGVIVTQVSTTASQSLPRWLRAIETYTVLDFDFSSPVRGVAIVGDYAYLAVEDDGLVILNVSSPGQQVGNYSTGIAEEEIPPYATSVTVAGDLAFVTDAFTGLHIVNISKPTQPLWVGTYFTHEFEHSQRVKIVGTRAFVVYQSSLILLFRGLRILDISVPSDPVLIWEYQVTLDGWDVAIEGDFVYLAAGTDGLVIINIANPDLPSVVGNCTTPGTATGVTVVGTLAYVTDHPNLQIINVTNPTMAYRISEVVLGLSRPRALSPPTVGLSRGMTVVGNIAFVANENYDGYRHQ